MVAPIPPAAADAQRARFLASRRLLALLVVVCVLLAVGVALTWRHQHPGAQGSPEDAIPSAQSQAVGKREAARLTQLVLSYNWRTIDRDIASTEKVLAPSFRSEYAQKMDVVRGRAVPNQVWLTASAEATSIVSATRSTVVALVFVNQVTQAKGLVHQRLDQNRVLVTLTRHGAEWRVSRMDAF